MVFRGRTPDPLRFTRLVRQLDTTAFDLVVAHDISTAFAAATLALPVAYVFHASDMREVRQRRSYGLGLVATMRSLAVEPVLKVLEGRAPRHATTVLVLSEFSRTVLLADRPSVAARVCRVSGGVDTDRWRPPADRAEVRRRLAIPSGTRVLLTARRLVARTGVDILVDAFAKLSAQHPDTCLVIVGDGEARSSLELRSRELGLETRVRFVGRISDDDLVAWYQGSDAFVLPTVAYEGFGMATVEALSSGLPVAATSVGATPELLMELEPRWLAKTPTSDALAGAITAVLGDVGGGTPQRCRDYAVERFSWARAGVAWEEALSRTLALHSAQEDS